jgi:4-hydroxy-4-methyl-2-oxoglutarate aldolase
VLGCVADGYIRDTNFLLALEFQTWSRGHTPRDIVGHWLPKAVDEEIRIGDVVIAPGDYLLGDRDGMVRLPRARAEEIVAAADTAIQTENKVRTAILSGVDPQEAYLRFGKF